MWEKRNPSPLTHLASMLESQAGNDRQSAPRSASSRHASGAIGDSVDPLKLKGGVRPSNERRGLAFLAPMRRAHPPRVRRDWSPVPLNTRKALEACAQRGFLGQTLHLQGWVQTWFAPVTFSCETSSFSEQELGLFLFLFPPRAGGEAFYFSECCRAFDERGPLDPRI